MLTNAESEALDKLVRWLSGFEESLLFQDYVQEGIFSKDEFEAVWCVLYEAIKRQKARLIALEGLQLCRILTPERSCMGCDREGLPLFVMARTPPAQAGRRLLFGDELGLCDECICEALIETKMPVTNVLAVEGDEAT